MNKNKSKWDQLSLSQKAGLLKIYADGGFTNLDDIIRDYNSREENNKQEDKKKIIEDRFPIMKTYKYNVYPDENVSKSEIGDIETFAGNNWRKDVINYANGYKLHNKYPGETSIVYNPNKVTNEDIILDALHIAREQDPVYQQLLKKYQDEARKTNYGDFWLDGTQEEFENGVDGVLRGSMYQGDRVKARYAPDEEYEELYNRYPELKKAYDDIYKYLTSGYIEPSVISANKKANGGTLPFTQSLQEQNATNLKTKGNTSFAEWYTQNYKKDYSEFFNISKVFDYVSNRVANLSKEDILNSSKDDNPYYLGTLHDSIVIGSKDKEYEAFLQTLPDNQKFTPEEDFSTKRYWELNGKPKDFEEAKNRGMYHWDNSDKSWHAHSIAWGEDGIGYFMKPKHHSTVKYELDYYNKGLITEEGGVQHPATGKDKRDWKKFVRNYDLDTSGDFYRYVPKNKFATGGDKDAEYIDYIKNSRTMPILSAGQNTMKQVREAAAKDAFDESINYDIASSNLGMSGTKRQELVYNRVFRRNFDDYIKKQQILNSFNNSSLNLTVPLTEYSDNTRVDVNPTVASTYQGKLRDYDSSEARFDDGPLGFVPFVGDALQAGQVAADLYNRDYVNAGIGAGMLLLPNFLEKTGKFLLKPVINKIKANKLAKVLSFAVDNENISTKVDLNNGTPKIVDANISDVDNLESSKTLKIKDFGRQAEIYRLKDRFNNWAKYYGYDTIPDDASIDEMESIMKSTFDRHNTFFRGVRKPDIESDIEEIAEIFGENPDLDEVLKYAATTPRKSENSVFISPTSNAGIYGGNGKTAIVRRKYDLSEDPRLWLSDADFDIDFGSPEIGDETFRFPWSLRGTGSVENELLAPRGTLEFVDFIDNVADGNDAFFDFVDSNGSLNKYMGHKFDSWGIDDGLIKKPKFALGGYLNNLTSKPFSYQPVPYVRYDDGGPYNIFTDESSYERRDAHRKSLEAWVKANPTYKGINTNDFVDFLSQIAGLEGSYKHDAGEDMEYSGYYGLKGGRDLSIDKQHEAAFKHLSNLFKESIVKEDIQRGIELGYTPAQVLAKYWNQGNRVTNFLYNGVDDTDALGTKISEYGWNINTNLDLNPYLSDAINDNFVVIKDGKTLPNAIKRARIPGFNYSNREKYVLNLNKDKNGKPLDATKLHVGDTIWLAPKVKPEK